MSPRKRRPARPAGQDNEEGELSSDPNFIPEPDTGEEDFRDVKLSYHVVRKKGRFPGISPFQVRLLQGILSSVLERRTPLDRAYAQWFSRVKLDPHEQGFLIRQVNAMFSHLSFYARAAGLRRPWDLKNHVNRLIICYCAHKKLRLPELDAGEGFERGSLAARIEQAEDDILMREGCPLWLNELCTPLLGDEWPGIRASLALEAPRYIRANTLKAGRDALASELSSEGVITKHVKDAPDALEVVSSSAIFRTQAYRQGHFEQQDAGSQEIAPFLLPEPGMRVIDACAGSGGKTLHLSALMQARGSIIALDTAQHKLDDLRARARRAGAHNVETRLADTTKVVKRLYDSADRVLIDAPCSATGILRRTPDLKWTDIRDRLPGLLETQQVLLSRLSRTVRPGGLIVYSTCSILPQENGQQARRFVEGSGGDFELEAERSVSPASMRDGFYMARIRRVR